ncbi:MAG: electron transfer flavoprotein subunit alpha/FixB family protein [Bifidobacteriaceae bacterium]|jgi:electron transfer flavoprotein alpha subunit|nr:electron transfer flavoprotein subunit alpha/FixB family protein [Bifidobacteriaceae bacterium]
MSTVNYVLVAGNAGVSQLIERALGWGGPVVAIVAGPEDLARRVAGTGVARVEWLGATDGRAVEAFAPAAARLVAAQPGNVLAGRRPAERVWLGAVAAAIGAPLVSGLVDLEPRAGGVAATREVGGGIALETIQFDGPVALMADGGPPIAAGSGDAEVAERTASDTYDIKVVSVAPADGAGGDLATAKLVVAAGRGFRDRGDLALAEGLARALGAVVACSRPLAEGLEWMGKERYVGISGNQIAPELYLAAGISGQLQHMSGVRGAGTVVAINTDAAAPIVAQADYALVGDLYEVLPALTAALTAASTAARA